MFIRGFFFSGGFSGAFCNMVNIFTCSCPNRSGVGTIDSPDSDALSTGGGSTPTAPPVLSTAPPSTEYWGGAVQKVLGGGSTLF